MQWLIDIIIEQVLAQIPDPQTVFDAAMLGTILMWSGNEFDVPDGWHLCNGEGGTVDLEDRFVYGALGVYNAHDSGGSNTHSHGLDNMTHYHKLEAGSWGSYGANFDRNTGTPWNTGSTDTGPNMPRFYALCFIQKV